MTCGNCGPTMVMSGYGGSGGFLPAGRGTHSDPTQGTAYHLTPRPVPTHRGVYRGYGGGFLPPGRGPSSEGIIHRTAQRRTIPRSQLMGPGVYEGVPLVEGQWDGVASHIPQNIEGMTVEEINIALANYMTAATNAFADTTFPLDGTFPPDRGAALEGSLEVAWGPNYGDILLTTPPEELAVMLGMPVDVTTAFQEAFVLSQPPVEKKRSVWPWIIGIGAAGVVASVITYAVVYK